MPAVTAAVPAIRTQPLADEEDEPKPWKAITPAASDSGQARRILLVGAGAGTLVLLATSCFVAMRKPAPRPIPQAAASIPEEARIDPAKPRIPEGRNIPSGDVTEYPMAYQLAVIEAKRVVPLDDPIVTMIDKLLKEADRCFVEDESRIADLAVRMHQKIEQDHQLSSLVEILDGSTRWQRPGYFSEGFDRKFEEYFVFYFTRA